MSDDVMSDINRKSWEKIGAEVVSPYLDYPHYRDALMQLVSRLPPGGRVLDLGCGPGTTVSKLLVDQGFAVVGIDFAEEMIELARNALPGAQFIHQSMTDINYVEQFDAVVASYSLLCLDPIAFDVVAEKIVRALKTGGWCFVALNEAEAGEDSDAAAIVQIAGQQMYSRAYSKDEVVRSFGSMRLMSIGRSVVKTDMFGDERSIVFVFEK